jgi:hypothetical protein
MPTIKAEYRVEVESTAERLWDILVDVKAWPQWQGTSYVDPPAAPLKKGSTFTAELGGHNWNVTVTEADVPSRLVWAGRQMGLKAVHEWEFAEAGGRTQALSRDTMTGWPLLFARAAVEKKVSEHDEKWLANLKSRAESAR